MPCTKTGSGPAPTADAISSAPSATTLPDFASSYSRSDNEDAASDHLLPAEHRLLTRIHTTSSLRGWFFCV